MRWRTVAFGLLVGSLALSTGCRGDARPLAERPPPAVLQLPANFPDDVMLPAQYRVDSVSDLGPLLVATLVTPTPVPQLFAESGRRMPSRGWLASAEIRHATGNAMRVYRKDGREVSLSFAAYRRGTDSVVTVQLRDPQRRL